MRQRGKKQRLGNRTHFANSSDIYRTHSYLQQVGSSTSIWVSRSQVLDGLRSWVFALTAANLTVVHVSLVLVNSIPELQR